jgi:universal stress protein A
MTTPNLPKAKRPAAPKAVLGRVKLSYPRIRGILVPLDFSGKSRQALRLAVPLAHRFGAKIALLHVIEPAFGGSPVTAGLKPIPAPRVQPVLRRLEETAAALVPRSSRGPNLVRMGAPAAEILAAARKLDSDMIVLATHGRTGLKRLLLGSTAEQVIRRAPCSVLSVRRQ